jgi:hypothetical protein
MAAGFSMKKDNIKILDNFIQRDYLKKNSNKKIQINTTWKLSSSQLKVN